MISNSLSIRLLWYIDLLSSVALTTEYDEEGVIFFLKHTQGVGI